MSWLNSLGKDNSRKKLKKKNEVADFEFREKEKQNNQKEEKKWTSNLKNRSFHSHFCFQGNLSHSLKELFTLTD